MSKSNETCQVKGCQRRASHQPNLHVWPEGVTERLPGRGVVMKLNVHAGVCKRCGDQIKVSELLNEYVEHVLAGAMKDRFNRAPDLATAHVTLRRI